jgi:prepilin-type N-terminal cleavage/methylation domain-containing protein
VNNHRSAFTLAELMLVLVILGVIMGMGLSGADRMDPGGRGLQRMVQSFVQSSRDRARSTGQNVVLRFEQNGEEDPGRFARLVYRRKLEANFEVAFEEREQVQLAGPAGLGKVGRFGAGLDLTQGGIATLVGKGGTFHSPHGLMMEFDFKLDELANCKIAEWSKLLELNLRSNGSLQWVVSWGDGVSYQEQSLATTAGAISPGRWHHLRAVAAAGKMALILNGKLLAEVEVAGLQPPADGALSIGDPDGRYAGWFDEVQVWGLAREQGPELSDDQLTFMGATEVVFDRHGRLDPKTHTEAVPVRISVLGEEIGAFQIGVFTEEPML